MQRNLFGDIAAHVRIILELMLKKKRVICELDLTDSR